MGGAVQLRLWSFNNNLKERDKTICGIVYRKSFNGIAVNQSILQLYKNQKHRGTQGFGFYVPQQNKIAHETREERIIKLLGKVPATEMLYHHRFPTSTDNVQNACHPFTTDANAEIFGHRYVLVHNGWINNDYSLRENHKSLGIEYVSAQPDGRFNDSEALLYDLALYLEGKQDKIKAEGAIAFVMIRDGKDLIFGRNSGSPLHLKMDGNAIRLASEGAGTMIEPDTLYEFNEVYKTFKLTQVEMPEYRYRYVETKAYDDSPTLKDLVNSYDDDVLEKANEEITHFFGDFTAAADSIAGLVNILESQLKESDDFDDMTATEQRIEFYRRVIGAIWSLMWEYEQDAEFYETFKQKGAMA